MDPLRQEGWATPVVPLRQFLLVRTVFPEVVSPWKTVFRGSAILGPTTRQIRMVMVLAVTLRMTGSGLGPMGDEREVVDTEMADMMIVESRVLTP